MGIGENIKGEGSIRNQLINEVLVEMLLLRKIYKYIERDSS